MWEKIINFVFIYIIVWWLVLFCILPFGIKREDAPEEGNDTGAPKNPELKKKFWVTSIIAFVAVLIWSYLNSRFSLI